ncbi:MAG: alpha/beta hydrolase [Betaproteobacteria bacterium]|nr:alpha/beta hydrolase [Betaproteobacteria bacterium]
MNGSLGLPEKIILLHGLRVNRLVMSYLACSLRRLEFAADTWSFPSFHRTLTENVKLLDARLESEPGHRIAIVAHNYGAVVALRYLQAHPDPRIQRMVLLGAPLTGSTAGMQIQRHGWGRWFAGASGRVWIDGPNVSVPAGVQVGGIAGTGRLGLGRIFARFTAANDGVVLVDETHLPGLADHLIMPVAHSVMLISPAVARQVDHFLRHGAFMR